MYFISSFILLTFIKQPLKKARLLEEICCNYVTIW